MKQLLILSGKGGTGKTTVATALIRLLNIKKFADCDVDAPNLHLSMHQNKVTFTTPVYGAKKARIIEEQCINCGLCQKNCRFDSIFLKNNQYTIDSILCEGCTVCELVCPVGAIELYNSANGILKNTETDDVFFTTASLQMGSGNTGLLVSEVKNQLKTNQYETLFEVIDGSPGIGCPVIASITGVDLVLVVVEASVSGIADMKRLIETAHKMKVDVSVCVNKSDINIQRTNEVISYCQENNIHFSGTIPYDSSLKEIAQGKYNEDFNTLGYKSILEIYNNIAQRIEGDVFESKNTDR